MSKSQRHIKRTDVQSQQGKGIQLEQIETIDDNLLPDASEIEKIKVHDPNIMVWLKARAEQEQNFRHDTVKRRDSLVESFTTKEFSINILGLILAFIIIISGMGISFYLITQGNIIPGSIFTGTTLVLAAGLFIRHNKNKAS